MIICHSRRPKVLITNLCPHQPKVNNFEYFNLCFEEVPRLDEKTGVTKIDGSRIARGLLAVDQHVIGKITLDRTRVNRKESREPAAFLTFDRWRPQTIRRWPLKKRRRKRSIIRARGPRHAGSSGTRAGDCLSGVC